MINQKQIIAILIAVSFTFTMILIGLFAVYKYYPTLIGLPPNPEDTVSQKKEAFAPKVEQRVVISRKILDNYQNQLLKKN